MATVNEKMTAIANEIRELSGTTDKLGLDEMASNVSGANEEIANQKNLILECISTIENKALEGGGSGGSSDPDATMNVSFTFGDTSDLTGISLTYICKWEDDFGDVYIEPSCIPLADASGAQFEDIVLKNGFIIVLFDYNICDTNYIDLNGTNIEEIAQGFVSESAMCRFYRFIDLSLDIATIQVNV